MRKLPFLFLSTIFIVAGALPAWAEVYHDWAQCTKAMEAAGRKEVCVADPSIAGYYTPASYAAQQKANAGDSAKKAAETAGKTPVPAEKGHY